MIVLPMLIFFIYQVYNLIMINIRLKKAIAIENAKEIEEARASAGGSGDDETIRSEAEAKLEEAKRMREEAEAIRRQAEEELKKAKQTDDKDEEV